MGFGFARVRIKGIRTNFESSNRANIMVFCHGRHAVVNLLFLFFKDRSSHQCFITQGMGRGDSYESIYVFQVLPLPFKKPTIS